jgi:hypothetical protein
MTSLRRLAIIGNICAGWREVCLRVASEPIFERWAARPSASVHSSDNTNVPFARIAKCFQRLLIGGTIAGGDSLFDSIELRHCGALNNPLFVGFHGFAARKKAAPIGYDGWPGELTVSC